MRYVQAGSKKFLIRGPWTVGQLKTQYQSFREKYPDNQMTFSQWLVNRGKVYFRVKEK